MNKQDTTSDLKNPSSEMKKTGHETPRKVSIDRPNPAASSDEPVADATNLRQTSSGKGQTGKEGTVPPAKPVTRVPSKPVMETTPGWAHPSQKSPNPIHLDVLRPTKKEVAESMAVPKFEKPTSSTNLFKIGSKGSSEKQTENDPDTKLAPVSTSASDPSFSKLKQQAKIAGDSAKITVDSSKSKVSLDRDLTKGKASTDISKGSADRDQSKSKLSMDKAKKVSLDKDIRTKVSIADDPWAEPKKNYGMAEKKRRPSRKRKDKVSQDKGDPSVDVSGDVAVAHPDFLDESYLEAVDNGPRQESRMSEEYFGDSMKPLRFGSHKKKSAITVFKERVHKKRPGRRTGGVAGVHDWELNKRLPDDVVPFQYTVYLEPRIESNIFFGRVSIAVDLVLPKSQIWLHARNLHITSTQLFDQNDNQIPVLGGHKFRKHEFFVIFLESNLKPGIYMINIDYNGILSDRSHVGMFKRSYKHRDGSNRHLVYTQLGPLYARRVFPCFDEPMFKATYEISIVRPCNDFIAISNMPAENEEEETPQRGSTTVNYYVTPPIAPFHLAMIICDFHNIPVVDPRISFPFNVFVRDERVEHYHKACDIVLAAIDWFQDYFHMKCPTPKLDLIVMPELNLPSLEGFSVIMIQEELLKGNDDYEYETLHYILTRAVLSQWIGGSVTINWWNDLWYKEGLTMMLTNLFLDKNYPEQQAIPNFLCYSLQPCMFYDTFVTSRKIDRTVTDTSDIADCMDPIAFTKAAAIFRMLEQFDPACFKDGMQTFLNTFHLQNATWKNLSEYLTSAFDKNAGNMLSVNNVLFSWSQYPGYPLVASALGLRAIAANQRRFLSAMDCKETDPSKCPLWEFPVSFFLSKDPAALQSMCLRADAMDTDARCGIPDGIQWYKVNSRQAGFFRVVYQDDEWNTIKRILLTKPDAFTVEDRANLLDDMFSLSRAGFTCYGHTLSTLTYLRYGKETHWLPWTCILKHLLFLKNALSSNENDLINFQNFVTYILSAVLTEDVWTGSERDDPLKRKLKLAILRLACTMEINSAKSRLAHLLKVWDWGIDNKKPKPEHMRFIMLRYGAPPNGYSDTQWIALWKMYQEEKKVLEKHKMLAMMAAVGNETQLNSMLFTIKNEGAVVDDQGFFTVLYEMATTRIGYLRVWDFIKTNWTYMTDRFGQYDSRLILLFPHVAQMFDRDHLVDELSEYAGYDIPTIQTAINYAKNNIYWNARYKKTVSSWLGNVQKTLSSTAQGKPTIHKNLEKNVVPNDRTAVNPKMKGKE